MEITMAAITLVISGAMTLEKAKAESSRIETKLEACTCEDVRLKNELEVMRQCVELCKVKSEAIIDFNRLKS